MFSALKRLTKKGEEKVNFPSGVAVMNPSMQKKFSRGIQYNMKIVLKGDRNTGKSCLLGRLQGGAFREEYIPTHEIQVACINWNYRGSDEVVKVEVWDVVDKAAHRKRRRSNSLKVTHEDTPEEESDSDGVALDAEFVDVYKGTHGVIMLLDITKTWTWAYVERELPKIPHHIPVLLMANFRDMGSHRVIEEDRILAFVEHLERPPGSAEINYTESSLKSGFGLRYIYRFLNMPFLILQRETLLRQLEANALEIEDFRESLQLNRNSEDQNYDMFIEMLEHKKTAKVRSPKQEQVSPSQVMVNGHNKTQETSPPPQNPTDSSPSSLTKVPQGKEEREQPLVTAYETPPGNDHLHDAQNPTVDDFHLNEELDPSFLGETSKRVERPAVEAIDDSSSEEEGGGNPMVEDYQDLSSDDEQPPANPVVVVSDDEDITPSPTYASEPEVEPAEDVASPSTVSEDSKQAEEESSSEDETPKYTIAGNIDLDSGPEQEADTVTSEEVSTDKATTETTEESIPKNESKEVVDITSQLSLAGLDDFMAEQLGKASFMNDKKENMEEQSQEDTKDVKRKKKKTKKEKQIEVDEDKPKKKKKKSKDPAKKKKKSVDKIETENADYELL